MTKAEQAALRRDMKSPQDLFTLVAENNTVALSNAFMTWGYNYSTSSPQQMINELTRMYNAGGQARQQALALAGGVKYRFGVFPKGYDEAILGSNMPPRRHELSTDGGGDSSGEWYADMDWGGIISSILGGTSAIIDSTNTDTTIITETTDGTPDAMPTNNTMMYVIIGGAAAIILIAILATRK